MNVGIRASFPGSGLGQSVYHTFNSMRHAMFMDGGSAAVYTNNFFHPLVILAEEIPS